MPHPAVQRTVLAEGPKHLQCDNCHVIMNGFPMHQDPNNQATSRMHDWQQLLKLKNSGQRVQQEGPKWVDLKETWSGERSAELVSTSETRNPKPELLKLVSNCETRNPKPETDSEDLTSPGPIETRNPKPETDSEDLPSPGPIETRNPKPTLKT